MKKRKAIYIIPNLFTTANMFCGFFAIISAIQGNFLTSAWAIIVAMIFDSMDGRVARLTRATSQFGVEYDSFSDLISFGIAPALVTYLWCLQPFGRFGWLAAFIFLACAALRLARFNLLADVAPKNYFQGLPSPPAAGTIATAIIFYHDMVPNVAKENIMLVLLLILGTLMISSVRFASFKEFKLSKRKKGSFGVLAVGVLTLVLIAVRPEVTLFVIAVLYIVISLLIEIHRVIFRSQQTRSTRISTNNR